MLQTCYLTGTAVGECVVLLCADTNWASGEDDHVVARAEYDFTAASEEEISVRAGDMLNLAPKGQDHRITFLKDRSHLTVTVTCSHSCSAISKL